jgi:hypothetical protein
MTTRRPSCRRTAKGASQKAYTLRGNHFGHSEIDSGSHRRFGHRALEDWRYNDVSPIDTGDVQDDPVLVLIVDYAPRITRIRVAALHFAMCSISAHLFEAPDLRPFLISPVVAVPWWQSIHTAKTALHSSGSGLLRTTITPRDGGAMSPYGLSVNPASTMFLVNGACVTQRNPTIEPRPSSPSEGGAFLWAPPCL